MERRKRLAVQSRANQLRHVMPLLNRGLRNSRKRFAGLMAVVREIPDDEYLRMSRNAHVRLDDHASRAIQLRSCFLRENHAERRSQHSCSPQHRSRGNDLVVIAHAYCHAVGAHIGDHRSGSHSHSKALQHLARGFGELRRISRKRAVSSFHKNDARLRGINLAEIVAQRVVRDLAQRASQLRASWPCADDHERHPRASFSGSRSRSAASNARSMRPRIAVASSRFFRPGANCSHSSWPKYWCVAPVATMSVS